MKRNLPRRSRACAECGGVVAPARVAIGYNVCLPCGERIARQRVHTVAPLHKSNYIVVTNRADLRGLNNKGGLYR